MEPSGALAGAQRLRPQATASGIVAVVIRLRWLSLASLLGTTLFLGPLNAAVAWARGIEALGVLERQAVDEALAARGLTIEPAPDGKLVGEIHVVNHEVFSQRDSYFQLLNFF